MQHPELLNNLRNLGLNQYEAQAYLALSLGGMNTAGEVAVIGKIARPRVYDVLAKLQEKGFVAMRSGRPVKYLALPIYEAVQTLKKYKETRLKDELEKLDGLSVSLHKAMGATAATKKYAVDENVWTLKGRNSIYSRIAEMVGKSKEHVILSAHPEGIVRKIKENLNAFEKANARGVKIHVVSPISSISDKRSSLHSSNSIVQRLASKIIDKKMPSRLVLTEGEALIFLTPEETASEDEVALWVNSPHLVQTLKESCLKD